MTTEPMPFQGSAIGYDFVAERDVAIEMRDGIVLRADIYRPARKGVAVVGRFPGILERTPYDKRRTSHSSTGRHFAKRGYVCVMQDVRGRWASDGIFHRLNFEGEDGIDTLAWMRSQRWSDGRLGTLGFSYTSTVQQELALGHPEGLKTQLLFDGNYNLHSQVLRQGGACEYAFVLQYALWMARFSHEAMGNPAIKHELDSMWSSLNTWLARSPLRPGASPLALTPFYEEWFFDMLRRGDYDDYWRRPGNSLEDYVDKYPDIPLFLETSWYGQHITGTFEKYEKFKSLHKAPKKLLIGTWIHGPETFNQSFAGDVDFGAEAALDSLNDVRSRWCDHYVKGMDTGLADELPVQIFVMGGGTGLRTATGRMDHGGRWRSEAEWPIARTVPTRFFLHGGGHLQASTAAKDTAPSRYTFDPADPVPTIGGSFLNLGTAGTFDGGGYDQRGRRDLAFCHDTLPLSARQDVLVFRTEPLTAPVEVTGPIVVKLWISSSAVDTDFTAKLIDEYQPNADYPQGYALNLTDSILRLRYRNSRERAELMQPGEIYEIEIKLQATSNLFAAGHRIRLDISSSNFPRFDVNPNSGEPLGHERERVVAQQMVFHDDRHPSYILLPIVPADENIRGS